MQSRTEGAPVTSREQLGEREVPARRRRRRWIILLAALVVGVSGITAIMVTGGEEQPSKVSGTDPSHSVALPWLSGASGAGVPDGSFAAWRGADLGIAGTWADDNTGMVKLPQLRPGGEYAAWNKPLDIAIGAIAADETWAAAAEGAYDQRWRASLTNLRMLWGSRTAPLYIRFAHESNGNWYPWSVDADNYKDFIAAWKRFRALQLETFPSAKLVFCLTRQSVHNGIDWRKTFPGARYVDVLAVDYYNDPAVTNADQWKTSMLATDSHGAPLGIERYRQFASSVGLPFAVPEWSGNAKTGDQPAFIQGMHDFFAAHAGTGPGELLYEILFNVVNQSDAQFSLYGSTRMPQSAYLYQKLW